MNSSESNESGSNNKHVIYMYANMKNFFSHDNKMMDDGNYLRPSPLSFRQKFLN